MPRHPTERAPRPIFLTVRAFDIILIIPDVKQNLYYAGSFACAARSGDGFF
jgi:hypothetical protein